MKLTLFCVLISAIILPMSIIKVEAASGSWVYQYTLDENAPAPIIWYGSHYHSTWWCQADGNGWIYQQHVKNIKVGTNPDITSVRIKVLMKAATEDTITISIWSSYLHRASTATLEASMSFTLTSEWATYYFYIGADVKGKYVSFVIGRPSTPWYMQTSPGYSFYYQHPIVEAYVDGSSPF